MSTMQSKEFSRRLLVESLETRQVLAGDVLSGIVVGLFNGSAGNVAVNAQVDSGNVDASADVAAEVGPVNINGAADVSAAVHDANAGFSTDFSAAANAASWRTPGNGSVDYAFNDESGPTRDQRIREARERNGTLTAEGEGSTTVANHAMAGADVGIGGDVGADGVGDVSTNVAANVAAEAGLLGSLLNLGDLSLGLDLETRLGLDTALAAMNLDTNADLGLGIGSDISADLGTNVNADLDFGLDDLTVPLNEVLDHLPDLHLDAVDNLLSRLDSVLPLHSTGNNGSGSLLRLPLGLL